MSGQLEKLNTPVGLKQIRADGCLGYLLWERSSGQAVAIDPAQSVQDDFRSFIQENALKLVAIVETHTHADHPSSSHSLKRQTGAKIVMGRGTTSARADRLVSSGDKISFGALELGVLQTPGHTPDGICLVYEDPILKQCLAFTGDTLKIGSTGRTDFSVADPGALFDSLRVLEERLPPHACILPGHDSSELLFSLLGVEQRENAQLIEKDREKFIQQKQQDSLNVMNAEVAKIVEYNLSSEPDEGLIAGSSFEGASTGVPLANVERVPAITVQKYAMKLEASSAGELYLDVRERDEFLAGHIPGVSLIPLSALALNWSRLVGAKKIYLSCQSGRRSLMAARTLDRLGITGVVNVTGGFQAWVNAGFPVEKSQS